MGRDGGYRAHRSKCCLCVGLAVGDREAEDPARRCRAHVDVVTQEDGSKYSRLISSGTTQHSFGRRCVGAREELVRDAGSPEDIDSGLRDRRDDDVLEVCEAEFMFGRDERVFTVRGLYAVTMASLATLG